MLSHITYGACTDGEIIKLLARGCKFYNIETKQSNNVFIQNVQHIPPQKKASQSATVSTTVYTYFLFLFVMEGGGLGKALSNTNTIEFRIAEQHYVHLCPTKKEEINCQRGYLKIAG